MAAEREDALVQHAFDEVLQGYLKSNHRKKVEVIERAFRFAREAHKGVRRRCPIYRPKPQNPKTKNAKNLHNQK